MTRKQFEARAHLERSLESLGFTADETRSLIRIEMTLHRWAEHECNGNIQREELPDGSEGKPRWQSEVDREHNWAIPDRERGALKRLDAIVAERNRRVNVGEIKGQGFVSFYHQTDPRGAALYIIRHRDVRAGEDVGSVYNRGICVSGR